MAAFKKHFLVRVGLISFVAIFISSAGLVLAAWQEPQSAPPEGNPAAPLDVSNQEQTKEGNLNVSSVFSAGRVLSGADNAKLIRVGGSDVGVQFLSGNAAFGRIFLSNSNNLNIKIGDNLALQSEFRFTLEDNGREFPHPVLLFGHNDTDPGLKYDRSDGKLKFKNRNGEWTDIGTGQGGGESLWQAADASKIYYTAGNVGIGTNDPTSKLSVTGNLNVTGGVVVSSTTQVLGTTTLATVSGRVGIGTDNPASKLHVISNADSPLKIDSSGTYNYIQLGGGAANLGVQFTEGNASNWMIWDGANDQFRFFTGGGGAGNIRMAIPTNGNIAIGNIGNIQTNAINEKLVIKGDNAGRSVVSLLGNPTDANGWVGMKIADSNNNEKWFIGGNNGDFVFRRNENSNDLIFSEEGNIYLKKGSLNGNVSIGFGGLSNLDVQGNVEIKKLEIGEGVYYSSANQANVDVNVAHDGSDGRFLDIVREDWWPEAYRGNNRLNQCDSSFEGIDCQSGAVVAPRQNDTKFDLNVEFERKNNIVEGTNCGFQPTQYTDDVHFCYRYKLLAQRYVSQRSNGSSYGGDLVLGGNLTVAGSIHIGSNGNDPRFVDIEAGEGVVSILRIADLDEGENPEFQLKYGAGASDHWGVYVKKNADNSLNFWQGDNRFRIERNGGLGMNYGAPFGIVPADNDNRQWANKKIFETGYDNNLTADFLKIYTAGVGERNAGSKITILSNGNVGIGNDNPLARLDVNGGLKFSGQISVLPPLNNQGSPDAYCDRSIGNFLIRIKKDENNKGWVEFGLSPNINSNEWGCDGAGRPSHTPKFDWNQISGLMKICITGVTYGRADREHAYRQVNYCTEFSNSDNNIVRVVNSGENGRYVIASAGYNLLNVYTKELQYERW